MDRPTSNSSADQDGVHLRRRLGLHHGVGVIVGLVIGTGIYVAPKGVMAAVGSPGLSLILWGVCGIMAIFGALCFAELGTTYPTSGEKYAYLHTMYGDWVAFMYLWMYMVMFRPGANAIKALTFGFYVVQAFYVGDEFECGVDERSAMLVALCLPCKLMDQVRAVWSQ